jgi:PTH1 family peptidyl-tRNA hydrolase
VKLIVGLGNPGPEYAFTPHNAGFLAIDRIAEDRDATVANRRCKALTGKAILAGHECLLAKPETYMNLSGTSVAALVQELELDPTKDLIVLYDELAFPLGELRLKQNGSANGHNGVRSLSASLGTEDWMRIRIGVGRPNAPDGREVKAGGRDYLLQPMRKGDLALLDPVLDRALQAVETILKDGIAQAMTVFNRRETDLSSEGTQ